MSPGKKERSSILFLCNDLAPAKNPEIGSILLSHAKLYLKGLGTAHHMSKDHLLSIIPVIGVYEIFPCLKRSGKCLRFIPQHRVIPRTEIGGAGLEIPVPYAVFGSFHRQCKPLFTFDEGLFSTVPSNGRSYFMNQFSILRLWISSFLQVKINTGVDRLNHDLFPASSGEDHKGDIVPCFPENFEEFNAICFRHLIIGNNRIIICFCEHFQCFSG